MKQIGDILGWQFPWSVEQEIKWWIKHAPLCETNTRNRKTNEAVILASQMLASTIEGNTND